MKKYNEEINPNIQNVFLASLPSPMLNFPSDFLLPSGKCRWGKGACGQLILSLLLLSPYNPLINCGVSPMGYSHSWTSPMSVPATGCSSSWTTPAWSPLHSATGCARSLLFCRLFTRWNLSLGTSLYSSMSFSLGCRWLLAPPWTFMDCRGTISISFQCLLMEVTHAAPRTIKLCYVNQIHMDTA